VASTITECVSLVPVVNVSQGAVMRMERLYCGSHDGGVTVNDTGPFVTPSVELSVNPAGKTACAVDRLGGS
jgi:hypothetical protein